MVRFSSLFIVFNVSGSPLRTALLRASFTIALWFYIRVATLTLLRCYRDLLVYSPISSVLRRMNSLVFLSFTTRISTMLLNPRHDSRGNRDSNDQRSPREYQTLN